jgi:hypothetical protein
MTSSDPFSPNVFKHILSPKLIDNGSGGFDVKVDIINVDKIVVSGDIVGPTGSYWSNSSASTTGQPGRIINTEISGFPTQSQFVTTDATGFNWKQGRSLFSSSETFTFRSGNIYMITGNLNVSTTNPNSSGIQVFLSTGDNVTKTNYVNSSNYQLYEYSSPGAQPRFGSTFSVVFQATSTSTTYGIFILQTVTSGTQENASAFLTTFNITQLN